MRFRLAFSAIVMAAVFPFAVPGSAHAADPARSHDLTGLEVTGLLGEELGQIASVSDATDGRDATVLVEASGMLDVGHRYFTLHRSQLSPGEDEDTVTAKATAADVLRLIRNDTEVAGR
ncbi:hypothetical protein ACIU1J_07230 [Azospirillum doebereinerae]|uniref:hypothetical protein n=1 Tax=Azospirillum doebereinerae TaxID=92933 RepID=UPI001EE57859|nr:hypothetical protein [Azospirillum doebereinerae]MCG5239101.1 hypothetical protein [Azospirillum doebereinerae]